MADFQFVIVWYFKEMISIFKLIFYSITQFNFFKHNLDTIY